MLKAFQILDTPPEADFDELAALAAEICGTPIGVISLVDEQRQWFKARVGMVAGEGPREHAICAHALTKPTEVLVVADASRDERFRNNPAVVGEPGIRFYAGAPLATAQGEVLGTLCVMDRKPRELAVGQVSALRTLSRQVMTQLELRRQLWEQARVERALRESEERYRLLFERNPSPMWVYDLESLAFLAVNVAAEARYGFTKDEFLSMTIKDIRPAEAVPRLLESVENERAGLAHSGGWQHRLKDGSVIDVEISSHGIDFGGKRARLVMVGEVTERLAAERAARALGERLRTTVESLADGFFTLDRQWRFTYANREAERVLQKSRERLVGELIWTVFPEAEGTEVQREYARAMQEGVAVQFTTYFSPLGAWFGVRAFPSEEGLAVYFRDVTAARRAEEALRESEERFRLLARATNDAIWDWDPASGEVWWNRGFELLCGGRRADVEVKAEAEARVEAWSGRVHPDEAEAVLASLDEALNGQTDTWSAEYHFRRDDGTFAYVLDRRHILRDADGRAVRVIGGMTDLTAQKAAEREARRLSSSLAGIVDALQEIATARLPLEAVMDRMAAQAQELTGAVAGVVELLVEGELIWRGVSGRARDHVGRRLTGAAGLSRLALETGTALISDDREGDPRVNLQRCRELGLQSVVVAPLRDGDQRIGVLKVWSDKVGAFGAHDLNNLQILAESLGAVIQRQRAADELRASEAHYRLLFASNPHPMWVFDLETLRFLTVNEAAVAHYGYTEEEFLAMTVLDIRTPADAITMAEALARLPAEKRMRGLRQHRKKTGEAMDMDVVSDAIAWQGRPARLVLANDVTERLRADAKLREQAALLDKAQDAILVCDLDYRITYWNRSAERLYGWTAAEAAGRSARELLCLEPATFDGAMARLKADGEWSGELVQTTKAAATLTIEGRWTLLRDGSDQPVSVLAINTDITERRLLEKQFLRAQRMESIGTLAGGIAHDLNNLLSPIVMGVDLIRQFALPPPAESVLLNMERSARRGSDLVKQVLSFARGVEGARVAVHLKHVVREVESMVTNTFPKNIEFESNIPADLWLVTGDPTQLNQVLLNLCVNARDAMPRGGRLAVTAANLVIDEQYAVMNRVGSAGRYVALEVSDDGVGMPQEVLDRVFEPFYTTKELGNGTGLGLSTVMGIVRSHGGFVNVYSEPGKGSVFKVYLPAQASDAAPSGAPDAEVELVRGRGELILLVDDETSILSVTKQTLEAFGYRVATAEDGAQGIGIYAVRSAEIAVVVTDMMMPVMDGPALISAMQRINPRVRVIAASGLNANGNVARASATGVKHFLAKPYSAETLLALLRQVLDEEAVGRSPFSPR